MADHRRLIICCDGTWNRAGDSHDGVPTPTNVRIFHNALARGAESDPEQVPRYFSGVGADGHVWTRLTDGSTGHGLSANIRSAYLWLATTYQPGDRLSFVGFSRGAFTVRSLVGMIERCGLLDFSQDPEAWVDPAARAAAVEETFRRGYVPSREEARGWQDTRDDAGDPALRFREELRPGLRRDPGSVIEFVGVWDTVGALGVPDFVAVADLFNDPRRFAFHDLDLAADVGCARHAMALDERRGAFVPTLWTRRRADGQRVPLTHADDERVKQLWFPGVHSDVGGGYPEHGLSDGALTWMISEAQTVGLAFRDGALEQLAPDPAGVLHDSCTGLYDHLASTPRAVPRVTDDGADTTVHVSARERVRRQPVRQDPYRVTEVIPAGEHRRCEVRARVAWSETGFFVEPGTYSFTAEGDWSDRGIPGGPAGLRQPPGREHPLHRLADLGGRLESRWHRVRGSDAAQFTGTKRWENLDWLELVGMVAHGAATELVPTSEDTWPGPDGHQYIRIGAGVQDIAVPRAGYLYAFANDAWGAYDNNRGSVRLTVQRRT